MPPTILLIGQGIAGTLLAWALRRQGCTVSVADADLPGQSTPVAAGIINPVTGKRFVKTWNYDLFFPAARQAYQELGSLLGAALWEEQPILRLLQRPEEINDWSLRCAMPEYAELLSESTDAGRWAPYLLPGLHFGLIHGAARVNVGLLLRLFRQKLRSEGHFLSEKIEPGDTLSLLKQYDKVVFCEGWQGQNNPFFPELPFQVVKGEALLISFDSEQPPPGQMLKKTIMVTPYADKVWWAGSPYQWQFDSTLPSAEGKAFILAHLKEMLKVPIEVVQHLAGIRPSTKDRRPLLLQSPKNPDVFLFNGLGTKGTLLAPPLAEQAASMILGH